MKNLNHLFIGLLCAILGSFLGLCLIESYWLIKGYKLGTTLDLLNNPTLRSNIITLSQVPNVGVFFLFYQTKRDKSAYGVILFFLLLAIPVAIQKFL